jgi:hypothetical protein
MMWHPLPRGNHVKNLSRRSLSASVVFSLSAACTAAALLCSASLHAAEVSVAQTSAAAKGTFKEWTEVLAIPNDSIVAADIQRNTAWFE